MRDSTYGYGSLQVDLQRVWVGSGVLRGDMKQEVKQGREARKAKRRFMRDLRANRSK